MKNTLKKLLAFSGNALGKCDWHFFLFVAKVFASLFQQIGK
jgi:hypothetical protein